MQSQQLLKERGPLGRLSAGEKKLEGKTFYLDNVKKRSTALLLEAISLLGGGIESFLHKDVSYVVTGSQECLKEKCVQGSAQKTSEGAQLLIKQQESGLSNEKPHPRPPRSMACGSRGKALLEKAIRNNERLLGSSVLSNARSWGVKILYVDDVLLYLKQLTRESFSFKHKKTEKTSSKQSSHAVKAAPLRSPYLKIEDFSRKYKPLHMQSMTFPALCYSGRFSPFESPPPPLFEKQTVHEDTKTRGKKAEKIIQDKSQTPSSCNPVTWRPRKKDQSYCECCLQSFTNLEEHLQSDQHRSFVLDPSNYSTVDQLVVEMLPGFDPNPSQQPEERLTRPPTPLPGHDVCELEALTDAETEHAVQVLRMHGSCFNTHICNLTKTHQSSGPASPPPNPGVLPMDTSCFVPKTDCQSPDASDSAMPVLTAKPQTQDTFTQQPSIPSLCPTAPCPLPDPYSLPPVLSPQVPYSPDSTDSQSHYSDPPVLSPQKYNTENTMGGGHTFEMDFGKCLFTFPLLMSVAEASVLKERAPNPEGLCGISRLVCSNNSLEFDSTPSHRSSSLPRQSSITRNPRKRCRSASPEYRHRKRKRTSFVHNDSTWSEQRLKLPKPQRDNMVEGCFSFDNAPDCVRQSCSKSNVTTASTSYSADTAGSEQMCSFSFPAVQSWNQAPNYVDSVFDHPPPLLSTKATIFDPPPHIDKPPRVISTQDAQNSLSLSTSICIEPALIPDLARLSSSSSDSDWDCDLISCRDTTSITPPMPNEQNCELDKELLHRPCPWMHDTSYESHLHTVLHPSTPATALCGEDMDGSVFSRTVVQIVEVQH
ncbi:uncharacterized protein dbf4b [Cololabis saira]|uniref:uncharacterized protein dbf4b n=1 Tax=Cololabis saira TaxID=129043 RepID=UPI002AD583ED|nr:uncharacterized protein dbf4b [Cololabis saira]